MWMILLLLLLLLLFSLILEWHVVLIFRFRAFQKHLFFAFIAKKQQKERIKNTYQQQKGKNTLITTNKYKQEKKWPI